MNTVIDKYPSRKKDKVFWIDRKDPIVYTEENSNEYISQEEVSSFKKNGFLIIPHVFSKEEVAKFNKEFDSLANNTSLKHREEFIKEPGSDVVRSIFAPHKLSKVFESLTKDKRIKKRVNFLLNDETYVHQARINAKPGFKGKEFFWHSDFETWHIEDGMPNMRAISCLITLNENTSYNGSLMLIPGSHKTYITCVGETPDNHYKESLRKQEYGVPDQDSLTKLYKESEIKVAECPSGSLILFDCNVMHGSNSNITPLARRNIFFVLNAVSNRLIEPFGGTKPRPNFIAERRF